MDRYGFAPYIQFLSYKKSLYVFPPTHWHVSLVLHRLMSVLQPLDDNYMTLASTYSATIQRPFYFYKDFVVSPKKTSQKGIGLPSYQVLALTYNIYSRPIRAKLLSVSFFSSNLVCHSSTENQELRYKPHEPCDQLLTAFRYGVKGVNKYEIHYGKQ